MNLENELEVSGDGVRVKEAYCRAANSHAFCVRHTHLYTISLTRIITSISRAKHLHEPLYGTESGRGNQPSRATAYQDSAMDDSVEKQKIEDKGSLRKWSGAAVIVYSYGV